MPTIKASTSSSSVAVGDITGLGTNVHAFLATPSSANLANAMTDETGTTNLAFATSPTLVTPDLGIPSAIDLTNATLKKVLVGPPLSGFEGNIMWDDDYIYICTADDTFKKVAISI